MGEDAKSRQLLEDLIEKRINSCSSIEQIDSEIYRVFGCKMCILFTDLCDFTTFVQSYGIIAFLQKMHTFKKIFIPLIMKHNGEVIKIEGDSFIVVFQEVDQALHTVREAINHLAEYNKDKDIPFRIRLCSGIGYGDLLKIGKHDVFGYEVNIASKLGEDLAKENEIYLSEAAKNNLKQLKNEVCLEEIFVDLIQNKAAYKVTF